MVWTIRWNPQSSNSRTKRLNPSATLRAEYEGGDLFYRMHSVLLKHTLTTPMHLGVVPTLAQNIS
jgi:hypothetical protein